MPATTNDNVGARMSIDAILTALLPIRDRRDRVVGYVMSSCPASDRGGTTTADADARAALEFVPTLTRLAGRSLLVPVTPALLREGVLTRFASTDAVWLVSTDALEDPTTRRTVDRLQGSGLQFALQGFPDGEPLPPSLIGSTLVLDALGTTAPLLHSRLGALLDAGLRPLVRNVDDRATRHQVLVDGGILFCGRLLPRGASAPLNQSARDSAIRALRTLAAYADGRPPDTTFDDYVHEDVRLGASLLRALGSASIGARGPRSVTHAITVLGRDTVMERLLAVTAKLLADAAHDPEIALVGLRRARLLEALGSAVEGAPHPRACGLAGLLSVAECALGAPSVQLAAQLDLPPVLADTLGDRSLPLGQLVDVVEAMEYGWWDDLRSRCAVLGIAPLVVSQALATAWRVAREEQS